MKTQTIGDDSNHNSHLPPPWLFRRRHPPAIRSHVFLQVGRSVFQRPKKSVSRVKSLDQQARKSTAHRELPVLGVAAAAPPLLPMPPALMLCSP